MTAQRRHTVVLSDVHLSQAHPDDPSDPLWMRYRRTEYHPDAELAALVDELLARVGDDPIELVFNGDLFDFDAPWVKDGESSFDEFPLDAPGCAEHVARMIDDHPGWFGATARVVAAGHRVLFTSGNHDVELYFPAVREAIRRRIGARAAELGAPLDDAALEACVRFRTWFHVTEDRIYLEHGSQYDMLNGVPNPMRPLTPCGTQVHPVCGKLAFKRTGSRMGYFNPYYEETFYMGLFGYLGHFATRYALSRRHIVRTWFLGAVRTCAEIWRFRHADHELGDAGLAAARAETGATEEAIRKTHALRVPSAERAMLPILRELWIDRLFLALFVLVASAVAFAVSGAVVGASVLGALVVAFVVYEIATPKPDIRTYDSAPEEVRGLLDIHEARAMCTGHTHRAFGRWGDDGRFWGNSGSWAPAFRDAECKEPVHDRRPLLWLTTEGEAIRGGLVWLVDGELVADGEGFRGELSRPERDGVGSRHSAATVRESAATRAMGAEPTRGSARRQTAP